MRYLLLISELRSVLAVFDFSLMDPTMLGGSL